MKKKLTALTAAKNQTPYTVYGVVHDTNQQVMTEATVRIYNKTIRGLKLLGETLTKANGSYIVNYQTNNLNNISLTISLYDKQNTLLKESEVYLNVPESLEVNINLIDQPFVGATEYEQLIAIITQFTAELSLAHMTKADAHPSPGFVAQKTGIDQQIIERITMTARFEGFSGIPAMVWYGILSDGIAEQKILANQFQTNAATFDHQVDTTFDVLMHMPVGILTAALQKAINSKLIATVDLEKTIKLLNTQQLSYGAKHPITGKSSLLYQNAALAGLDPEDIDVFINARNNHAGSENDFWDKLQKVPGLKKDRKADALQAVMKIAQLTGNNPQITEDLVKTHRIKTTDDIKKLAVYNRKDWVELLKKNKASFSSMAPGKNDTEKVQHIAAQLETMLTKAYPTETVAARLKNDTKSRFPHREKVAKFLRDNGHFNLLNDHVGTFIKNNKKAVAAKDSDDVAEHLRRIQRVMKLTSSYDNASILLNDGIHSAQQVYKMGQDNFMSAYSDKFGADQATQIYESADAVHSTTMALTSNLKAMADASSVKSLSNFSATMTQQLGDNLPNMDTLFGHNDYCECSECRSVCGAPAYLTDILHYLDKRNSTLPMVVGERKPSVKDILLRRRPDIADIDLGCDNTNTLVPYIDIACELMEDHISPPVVTLPATAAAQFTKGTINSTLLTAIKNAFIGALRPEVGSLLTAAAVVSEQYAAKHLQTNDTYVSQKHWVIRDAQVVLRGSQSSATSGIDISMLHQTLLSADAISSGPEYVNNKVYTDFLKTAKMPFSLPFDLFETEGGLYLEKLGIRKSDLIGIFRKEDKAAPGKSVIDYRVAYAALNISEAEQTLIFIADVTNPGLYWGNGVANNAIQVNIFEKLTGLNYNQILELVMLQFINPSKDTLIEHDDLSANITKQRLTNITPAKLDAIHRFLRLWRKTSFTMAELDAIIMAPAIGAGKIASKLALQLYQFNILQKQLQLNTFQLLAFYQNIDTTHGCPDCLYNQMFQNKAIVNPPSANFTLAAATSGTIAIAEADKAVIAAVLQISLADVNSLLPKTNGKVALASLTTLYRFAQLAQSIKLSIADMLTLTGLIDANPFLDLQATMLFMEKYALLQSSGFNIDELNYILRDQDNSTHTLVPATTEVAAALARLQDELLTIRASTKIVADASGLQFSRWLSESIFNWDTTLLSRMLDILNTQDNTDYQRKIDSNVNFLLNLRIIYHLPSIVTDLPAMPVTGVAPGIPVVFPATIAQQLNYDTDKKQLKLVGYMSAADMASLLALSTDANYQQAVRALYDKAQLTDSSAGNSLFGSAAEINNGLRKLLDAKTTDRFALMLNKLSPVYKKQQQQNALIKDISTWFTMDRNLVSQLLASVPAIYAEFTDDVFVNRTLAVNTTQSNRYLFIAKLAFAANRLQLTSADLAFLLPNAAEIGALNFLTLPLIPLATVAITFPGFENLINLLKFVKYYPAKVINGNKLSVYSILVEAIGKGVLTGADLTAYTSNLVVSLAQLTGWSASDLTSLIVPPNNNLTLILPADIKSVPILLRLHRRFATMQQLGISLLDCFAWAKNSLLPADTARIKQILKQKYSSTEWQQVTMPLQNILREKKRDALIAYLLANPGVQNWKDEKDLYAYFLIDVEMCSCQPTTRIVQATNTVQLFVQRSFLQLESGVRIESKIDSNWLQWEWMKNFRVWQANAKIFLYPENYIEPELLPKEIKSPFMSDLENDLLQGEITAENAEVAFQAYLQKLRDVARLEIKGQFYDEVSRTLHVFGRNFDGDPKTYYYRKRIENRRWTPWVKVDLDINSDFIVPVVYNNHIYLFWAIIKPITDATNAKQWQIQLAFSEFTNGKWSAKKTSGEDSLGKIVTDQFWHPSMNAFFFTPLDIPLIDYKTLIGPDRLLIGTPDQYMPIIKNGIIKNGVLIISCFYYDRTKTPDDGSTQVYIGSFQLDIAKGYPVKTNFPVRLLFQSRKFTTGGSAGGGWGIASARNMVNMFDLEITDPVVPFIPGASIVIPNQSRGRYKVLPPLQMSIFERNYFIRLLAFGTFSSPVPVAFIWDGLPYFFMDQHRSYYVTSEAYDSTLNRISNYDTYYYSVIDTLSSNSFSFDPPRAARRFYNFFHPQIGYFMERLFTNGVDGLMSRETQLKGDAVYDNSPDKFNFSTYYPNTVVDYEPGPNKTWIPVEDVDFNLGSGYGLYNWELFYHAPLLIAERLSQNQKFDAADRWYKYIFNPTDTSGNPAPNKFWNTKPFFETTGQDYLNQRIDNVLNGISTGTQADLIQDVTDWRNNPFQPHYIAQYRTVAYQKVAVMKYVGHLIRYGDYLFAQDTMESVNQATQLYLLASEILGPKPEVITPLGKTAVDNYYQLEQKLDAMSDAMVNVENLLPFQSIKGYTGTTPSQGLPNLQTMYYCIPMNENMTGPTGYWDMITDRLYKIRHCMNIDGTVAPLALFAPPINPAILVRAAAAGIDIGSVLNDMNAPLPAYRFAAMVQKASELVNEVKMLGAALLSALEKKDTETISLLRASQEIRVQNATILLKKKQIEDSQNVLSNLFKQKELTIVRKNYYNGLIKTGLNSWEKGAIALHLGSLVFDTVITASYFTGSVAAVMPLQTIGGIAAGMVTGPFTSTSEGGQNIGDSAANMARNLGAIAAGLDKAAALTDTTAAYNRRSDEWKFQLDLANKDLEQLDIQIAGAQLRISMANQDAANQQLIIDNATDMNMLMHSKYTNEDLYNWMITQISTTYFKTYQLAYDVAKRTERSFRYELGLNDSAYINFGYWDNLKKGLLAGEQLGYDLKNLEMAYYEQNKRELELTKPISLSQLDPVALLKLKTTGECWINLPEELFDMDYPGHYMRRIKSVALTIPCITGPYTTVNCKLTMTNNSVRTSALAAADAAQYPRKLANGIPADDPRFKDAIGALQSIATSHGQNDSGLFELNFRDERYLPFEGSGAISLWHIELPSAVKQFNYDTISDVIIHLKYTARDGGDVLKNNAATSLNSKINQMLVSNRDRGLMRIFSAKNDLSTEWFRFLHPINPTDSQVLTLNLDKSRFPLFAQSKTIKIKSIELIADTVSTAISAITVTPAPLAPTPINLTAKGIYGKCLSVSMDYNTGPGIWQIVNPVANSRLTPDTINNMVIIVHYEVA
jgi:hypothetical protein